MGRGKAAVERVEFKNQKGDVLVGAFHAAKGTERPPLIITCPGLLSTKDGKKHLALAAKAPDRGFSLFRFDFAGLGEAGGRFEDSYLTNRVADLQSALSHLRARGFIDELCPIGLVGSSFGAPVALLRAVREKMAGALVTWAAAFDLEETLAYSSPEGLNRLKSGHIIAIEEAGRQYDLGPVFLDDFARYNMADEAKKLSGCASLFIHGRADRSVPYRQSEKVYQVASEPKKLILYEGAGHRLEEVIDQVMSETLAWFERYLRPA